MPKNNERVSKPQQFQQKASVSQNLVTERWIPKPECRNLSNLLPENKKIRTKVNTCTILLKHQATSVQ